MGAARGRGVGGVSLTQQEALKAASAGVHGGTPRGRSSMNEPLRRHCHNFLLCFSSSCHFLS